MRGQDSSGLLRGTCTDPADCGERRSPRMASLPDLDFAATSPTPLAVPFHAVAPDVPALRLLVKGFSVMEHRLLEGTVKLSQRRSPRLHLLDDAAAESADIVMVDGRDPGSMQWARRQGWLARKAVIW